jgi:ABC-type sugar transport system permease subunit
MAGYFGRSLVALGGVLLGYLVLTVGDRYENSPRTQQMWRRAGYIIMAVAGVVWLIMVRLPAGLLFVARQLVQPLPLALLAGIIVFGLFLWAMWREPSATAMNARARHEEMLNGWLFLSPNLLGFLIFFAGPLALSLYFSFTNSDAFNTPDWVGFDNYARILNMTLRSLESATQPAAQVLDITRYDEVWRFTLFGQSFILGATDKLFWLGLRNTLAFSLLAVPLSVVPALLLANILNSSLPGMKFFRAVYFLPSIAAVVGIALVWQWLYNATIGYINYFITLSVNGMNGLFGLAIADPSIKWLSDQRTALLSIVILFAWQRIGFNTVLFLAGLQTIPKALYEAATVDGAGRWAKFRHVTVPLLSPTTFFVVTTTTILAMQLFEQVFILMNQPEGPNNSTVTLVTYLYRSGFQNFRQGYASAISWVLFIMIFAVTLIQFRNQASNDVEG